MFLKIKNHLLFRFTFQQMKYVIFIIALLSTTSCRYFNKKKVTSKDIISQEMQTFNWDEVDEYPYISSCDDSNTSELKENCFKTTITTQITTHLSNEKIVVTQDINDTIRVTFVISEKGVIDIKAIKSNPLTKAQIPNINNLFINGLQKLPKIFPAIKRGQQVKTEFILPVIVRVH